MNAHELKGKALEMLAAVHDSDSLAQILAFIEQFIPGESLDAFAPDDDALNSTQKTELRKMIQESRNGQGVFISKEAFFKDYERWTSK